MEQQQQQVIDTLPADMAQLKLVLMDAPAPAQVIVTKDSAIKFLKAVDENGLDEDETYILDTPISPGGVVGRIAFKRVVAAIVHYSTGIVPANG